MFKTGIGNYPKLVLEVTLAQNCWLQKHTNIFEMRNSKLKSSENRLSKASNTGFGDGGGREANNRLGFRWGMPLVLFGVVWTQFRNNKVPTGCT